MNKVKPLLTLSTAGIIKTPNEKIDWIMSYFLETMQSQTNETKQYNTSFQEILQRKGHDQFELKNELQNKLPAMFNRYFASSNINIAVNEIPDSGGLSIVISGTVTEVNGKEYSIAESLEAQGINFKRVMVANN